MYVHLPSWCGVCGQGNNNACVDQSVGQPSRLAIIRLDIRYDGRLTKFISLGGVSHFLTRGHELDMTVIFRRLDGYIWRVQIDLNWTIIDRRFDRDESSLLD